MEKRTQQFYEDAKRLMELWESKPSETLFATACRLPLEPSTAERLVVLLVSEGMVVYGGNPFVAKFV